jgi:hypothetical protein
VGAAFQPRTVWGAETSVAAGKPLPQFENYIS